MNGRWPGIGVSRSAGVPWTPANEPTVTAWFDETFASSITLSSGSVSQWTSRVGAGVLTEGTQADMPTKETGWLRFNNQRLFGTQSAGAIFCVVRPTTGTATSYGFIATRLSPMEEPLSFGYDEAGVSYFYSFGVGLSLFREDGADITPPPTWDTNKPTNNPRTPSASWGTPILTAANFTTTITTQGLGSLAAGPAAGGRVLVAQYIILSGDPTLNIYQRLEGWAAHNYGVAGKLPAGHPYKSAPPMV